MKAVLFDLDGTLLDTSEDLTDSVNCILERYSYPRVERKTVIRHTGNAARYLLKNCIGETTEEKLDVILKDYRAYYAEHYCVKTKPYNGIPELLKELRDNGRKIAIASNKPLEVTKRLCECFFPGIAYIGETAGICKKPDPMMINIALNMIGASADDAVYVGDSEVDILTAKKAGIPCISVTWGFRTEQELRNAGATKIAHSCKELTEIIRTASAENRR